MNIAAVLAIASSSAEVLKLAVELIKTATREGRDITPAELEALRHRREQAFDDLDSAIAERQA